MRRVLTICAGVLVWTGIAAADLRVSTADAMKAAVNKPQPVYTALAKQMKITGRIEVEAGVDETGKVSSAKALSGNRMLTQATGLAVEKWKFAPFKADRKPEKAVFTLVFDFRPYEVG